MKTPEEIIIGQAARYVDSWQVGDGPNTLAIAVVAALVGAGYEITRKVSAGEEPYEYPDDDNAREHAEYTREKYRLDDFYPMPGTYRDSDGHVKPLPRT